MDRMGIDGPGGARGNGGKFAWGWKTLKKRERAGSSRAMTGTAFHTAGALTLLLAAALVASTSAAPYLVKDIASGREANWGSFPVVFYPGNNTAFFRAWTQGYGNALWTTDGTEEGTRFVTDPSPGFDWPYGVDGVEIDGTFWLIFGQEVIVSDGTPAGTHSMGGSLGALHGRTLIEFKGAFHVLGYDRPGEGTNLCLLRGDSATGQLVPLVALEYGANSSPALQKGNGILWIQCQGDGRYALEGSWSSIWTSDGTSGGTRRVVSLDGIVRGAPVDNDYLFFQAPGSYGMIDAPWNLWRTDGTPCHMEHLSDGATAGGFNQLGDWISANGRLFFWVRNDIDQWVLWTSDRTAAGTVPIMVLPGEFRDRWYWDPPRVETNASGIVFFSCEDQEHGWELWRSDGTPGGTFLLRDIYPGAESSTPCDLTSLGDFVLFTAEDGESGRELWITDGSPAGTVQLKDIAPGSDSSWFWSLTRVGNRVFFQADDGVHGPEPWVTDGTPEGTRMIRDIFPPNNTPSCPAEFHDLGGFHLFHARTPEQGVELWRTDGTGEGTQQVLDVSPGPQDTLFFYHWTRYKDFVLFPTEPVDSEPARLWRSDGTATGTIPLITLPQEYHRYDLDIDAKDLEFGPPFATFDAPLLFALRDDRNQGGLYRTDGTLEGTYLLLEGEIRLLEAAGDFVVFAYRPLWQDPSTAVPLTLWRTDGTVAGTQKVFDPPSDVGRSWTMGVRLDRRCVFSWPGNRYLHDLWITDGTAQNTFRIMEGLDGVKLIDVLNERLYMICDKDSETWLWETDGTPEGTAPIAQMPFAYRSNRFQFRILNGRLLLFFPDDFMEPVGELWSSDGTAAGTYRIRTIAEGAHPMLPITRGEGDRATSALVYLDTDAAHGLEPWVTDGTVEGTRLLGDLQPGLLYSGITLLTAWRNLVFMTANDGEHGLEIWVTDGTPLGTVRATDLWPGAGGINPQEAFVRNDTLYFAADDGSGIGDELWALPLAGLPLPTQLERDILARVLGLPSAPVVDDQNADGVIDLADFITVRNP